MCPPPWIGSEELDGGLGTWGRCSARGGGVFDCYL